MQKSLFVNGAGRKNFLCAVLFNRISHAPAAAHRESAEIFNALIGCHFFPTPTPLL